MADDGVEVARITITRSITREDDLVEVETSGEVGFLDAMGMLVMAQQILDRRHDQELNDG